MFESTRRLAPRRSLLLFVPVALFVAACGGDDDGGTATTEAPATDSATTTSSDGGGDPEEGDPASTEVVEGGESGGQAAFDELVAAAGASNNTVRMALDAYTTEETDRWEQLFEERFGFPLQLENEPGHPSQEIPQKVLQSAQSDRGIVDLIQGGTSNNIQVFTGGAVREPNWAALEAEWPVITSLRERVPPIESDGEMMGSYCTVYSQVPWLPFYSTDRVDSSEIDGFVWDDLTDPRWEGRVVLDANAAGMFVFPFADGWDEQRLAEWTSALGDNNPTIVTGGSAGVMQAVLQGEGDIGISISRVVDANRNQGAPVDYVIPGDFIPVDLQTTCLVDPPASDPAMAELFWGWLNAEMIYIEAEQGGNPRLWAEEADNFPIAARIAEVGLTEDDLVYARTVEEYDRINDYRATAIDGFTP